MDENEIAKVAVDVVLMNFGEEVIKDGTSRVVNRLPDASPFAP